MADTNQQGSKPSSESGQSGDPELTVPQHAGSASPTPGPPPSGPSPPLQSARGSFTADSFIGSPDPANGDLANGDLANGDLANLSAESDLLPPVDDEAWQSEHEQRFWIFTVVPSGLLSAIIHLLLFIGLGLSVIAIDYGASSISLQIVVAEPMLEAELLEDVVVKVDVMPEIEEPEASPQDPVEQEVLEQETVEPVAFELAVPGSLSPMLPARVGDEAGYGVGKGHVAGGASGRAQRRQRAFDYGATPESEHAVDLALAWIVRHQKQDGAWNFDHRKGDHGCRDCECRHPGYRRIASRGATSLGLLALQGAGHTHRKGEYQEHVARGLRYLLEHQSAKGSFHESEGNMYSHGLATLALCEALAMTPPSSNQRSEQFAANSPPTNGSIARVASLELRGEQPDLLTKSVPSNAIPWRATGGFSVDRDELANAAQRAIRFIEKAQHRRGGWRYQPGEAGDTSVVGWQLMALKSGHLAGLDVDQGTITKARRFLSSVAKDEQQSFYSYRPQQQRRGQIRLDVEVGATTAIGLLSRMYTGWPRENPGITLGVRRLDRWARPDKGLYYYYYATQVMHHHGGPLWDRWNQWMRGYLIKTQSRDGAEQGSWRLTGSHDDAGRLYCTTMAAMTLEVYYRYSPIYGAAAVDR